MMMMMERSPKHVVFSKSVVCVCERERERDIPKFVVC